MGRPFKTGLDYFELDCYLDEKIKLIQAEYGLKGFAVIVLLFKEIYGGRGYYMSWDKERLLLLASENGIESGDTNLIWEVSQACIRRGIFSTELFKKYHILTSRGIQKRYFRAVARRGKVEVREEYLLVKVDQNLVNVSNNSINADKNEVNVNKSTQRREENRREENNNACAYVSPDQLSDVSSGNSEELEEDDDEGMDPMEAMRIWKEQERKK